VSLYLLNCSSTCLVPTTFLLTMTHLNDHSIRRLFLLVLEAGIDIDLTTLKLIGARGFVIALVGTFLPIAIAFGIANILGYRGVAAVAAGCTFAPTSLGIAMNVLRQSNIANTPVGQLIVAAAIIDDMVACKFTT